MSKMTLAPPASVLCNFDTNAGAYDTPIDTPNTKSPELSPFASVPPSPSIPVKQLVGTQSAANAVSKLASIAAVEKHVASGPPLAIHPAGPIHSAGSVHPSIPHFAGRNSPVRHDANTNHKSNELPLHVLLVEDSDIVQKVMLKMCQQLGYTCSIVGNGRDALEAIVHSPLQYDVVLSTCPLSRSLASSL